MHNTPSLRARRPEPRLRCAGARRAIATAGIAALGIVFGEARFCFGQTPPPSPGSSTAPALKPALSSSPRVETILRPIIAKYEVPGMGAAVIFGEDVVAIGTAGVRKLGDPTPMTIQDKFHLGSCTKAMTATLIARLVEDGTLAWTTTLAESFPELASTMHADYRNVTMEQLLTHRGGVPTDLNAGGLWARLWQHTGTPVEQRRTLVEGILTQPPQSPPGTQYIYSNGGFAIAGAIVEKRLGRPWEELITQRLFEPLGITSAGFGAPGAPPAGGAPPQVDQPLGHAMSFGKLAPVIPGKAADNPAAIGPAGTVHMTLSDWARFVSLHLRGAQGKGRLLKPETFRKLHTPASGQDYAFGWGVAKRGWGGTVLTHAGSNTMWYCVVWIAPEKDFAVIVACNRGGDEAAKGCDEAAWGLIQSFLVNPPKSDAPAAP